MSSDDTWSVLTRDTWQRGWWRPCRRWSTMTASSLTGRRTWPSTGTCPRPPPGSCWAAPGPPPTTPTLTLPPGTRWVSSWTKSFSPLLVSPCRVKRDKRIPQGWCFLRSTRLWWGSPTSPRSTPRPSWCCAPPRRSWTSGWRRSPSGACCSTPTATSPSERASCLSICTGEEPIPPKLRIEPWKWIWQVWNGNSVVRHSSYYSSMIDKTMTRKDIKDPARHDN